MNKSWIYIIGSESKPYKIGFSKTPEKRLKSLQTGFPQELKILHLEEINDDEVRNIEKCIHKENKLRRTHGEWFNLELNEAIAEVQYAIIRYSK